MGLFGNKKKGSEPSVRTLSEREIQSRLYGHLREPGPVQEDLPTLSKPKLQDSSILNKTTNGGKNLTPSATPSTHKPSISAPELFEEPESEVAAPKSYGEVPKKQESLSAKNYMSTHRSEKVRPVASNATFQKTTSHAFQTAGQGLKAIGLKLLELVGWALGSVIRLITSINFKSPAVRRALSMAFGFGVLALVFFGVHLLNVQREAAMKRPPKVIYSPVHSVVQTTPAQESVALSRPEQAKKDDTSSGKKAETHQAKEATKTPESSATAKTEASQTAGTAKIIELPKQPQAPRETAQITGPAYVIQVATFATQADAQKLADRFKAESFRAFVKPLSRSGNRVYYCVFIGKFKTSQEADTTLSSFKQKNIAQSFQDAFVRMMQ